MQKQTYTMATQYKTEESRLLRLMEEYMQLTHMCETQPQRMAKKINALTEEAVKWERRADKWRSKHIKTDRALQAAFDSIEIWREEAQEMLDEIKALKTEPLYKVIYRRFKIWFFGPEGDK
mgnify:CR=1 FL=1|tara:strand:- start:3031 stop:3393 length:363 start_codon:yes stop_codon:yes gene_type:complete